MLLVTGLFTTGELSGPKHPPQLKSLQAPLPTGPLHELTLHTSGISTSSYRPTSFPEPFQAAVYPVFGAPMEDILPGCLGGKEKWQRGQVSSGMEQESETGCYVNGDSPAPLTWKCGIQAPGQIL